MAKPSTPAKAGQCGLNLEFYSLGQIARHRKAKASSPLNSGNCSVSPSSQSLSPGSGTVDGSRLSLSTKYERSTQVFSKLEEGPSSPQTSASHTASFGQTRIWRSGRPIESGTCSRVPCTQRRRTPTTICGLRVLACRAQQSRKQAEDPTC